MVTVLARNLGVRSTSLPEPLALGLDWLDRAPAPAPAPLLSA